MDLQSLVNMFGGKVAFGLIPEPDACYVGCGYSYSVFCDSYVCPSFFDCNVFDCVVDFTATGWMECADHHKGDDFTCRNTYSYTPGCAPPSVPCPGT